MEGRLQIPDGFKINLTKVPALSQLAEGAIVHAWHSQSWAMHMFEVASSERSSEDDEELQVKFSPGGGRQGGRNWCRCDQCSYAGPWCNGEDDDRLISGTW